MLSTLFFLDFFQSTYQSITKMVRLLELTVTTQEMLCNPVLFDCVRLSLLPLTVLEIELSAIADTTTKVESTTAIADTTTKVESTTAIADTTTIRKVREDGYLIPIVGDKVYTYTGGMFGASKWTATVIKINEDGKTMQIEKDWQKTKSNKPSRMTVDIDTWKVENDPQHEIERQKAKEEKMKEKAEEKAKNMAAKEATEKAYNDAIASGKEIPFDVKKAKKGDVITTYCENTYMGNCSIYKYKYRELREDGETILASPIKENGRASSAQLCVGSIKRGKITILKSEKKTDGKPEKKKYYCDRQWALSGVSPWVDARLTNMFNQIDDYPHDFNKNRERMIEGLENWKYQQKYRLTEIDIKRIDYVIKCFS